MHNKFIWFNLLFCLTLIQKKNFTCDVGCKFDGSQGGYYHKKSDECRCYNGENYDSFISQRIKLYKAPKVSPSTEAELKEKKVSVPWAYDSSDSSDY